MIRPRTIQVGEEPVELTAGSLTSGVSIQLLDNAGHTPLYYAEARPEDLGDEAPCVLDPGAQIQGLSLGATDRFFVWRPRATGDVRVVLGWAS